MILTIRADEPETLLDSILQQVDGCLATIHLALNQGNKTELLKIWTKDGNSALLLIGSDPADKTLKLKYGIDHKMLKFEFEHFGGFSSDDFKQFYKDLIVFLLDSHHEEFEFISVNNPSD